MQDSNVEDVMARRRERERRRAEAEKRQDEVASKMRLTKQLYQGSKDDAVLLDVREQCHLRYEFHIRMALDGVVADKDGNITYLTPAQRASELDKAAGAEEISAYIERMLKPLPKKKSVDRPTEA